MKLIKFLVFFMSMDRGESSGKGKSGQKGENDLVVPVAGGSCPSLPPMDGIERHYDPQPNPNGPSNPNIADYRRKRLNMS